jgi:Na+-driven multidrug efflux pump
MVYSVSYVIYAYILFAVLPEDMKIYGVHIALSCAYITEVIFATVIFFSGKWKSKAYIELEQKYLSENANKSVQ